MRVIGIIIYMAEIRQISDTETRSNRFRGLIVPYIYQIPSAGARLAVESDIDLLLKNGCVGFLVGPVSYLILGDYLHTPLIVLGFHKFLIADPSAVLKIIPEVVVIADHLGEGTANLFGEGLGLLELELDIKGKGLTEIARADLLENIAHGGIPGLPEDAPEVLDELGTPFIIIVYPFHDLVSHKIQKTLF